MKAAPLLLIVVLGFGLAGNAKADLDETQRAVTALSFTAGCIVGGAATGAVDYYFTRSVRDSANTAAIGCLATGIGAGAFTAVLIDNAPSQEDLEKNAGE